MPSLKNTIEDIVVDEATTQIDHLSSTIKKQINLSEVVAYALNRLPPMYASTDRGWLQQRKRAHNEMEQSISSAVRHAMMAVTRDPLRLVGPLPQEELESPVHSLAKLRSTLNKPYLRWKEIPGAVKDAIDEAKQGQLENRSYFSAQKRQIIEVKEYLKRTKVQNSSWRDQKMQSSEPDKFSAILQETKEFESYMLPTSCVFTNALEKLVIAIAGEQMQRLDSMLSRHVKLEDAAAYTLNRLMPMYATSSQGLIHHQQRAKAELISEISSTVIQSFLTLSKSPRRMVEPIPFAKFDYERDRALDELKLILQRDDITWLNVPDVVTEALNRSKDKTGFWRKQSEMLAELHQSLKLLPEDVDFYLIHRHETEIMIIKVDQKSAFSILVEHPRDVAMIVLKYFPSIDSIEIQTSLLTFPLTYTRAEMATDGVF